MDVEVLKGFLRIGVFIGGCGLLMVFTQTPGTPEYVLSVCSTFIGLALVAGVLLVSRWVKHLKMEEDDHD